MGCKAITPHLVSLAKRLEGKPFHLLAAHCQNGEKSNVVNYIKSKGLAANTPNFTVTSFGGHRMVKGNGYVPYYMVFDQHGELAHHHMCGDYHGGDGLAMIEWVDKLLKDVPAIYLGKEPFVHFGKLAKKVGAGKNLPAVEKQLATATPEQKPELERLWAAVTDYRTRMLAKADGLMASDPGQILPTLKALEKSLKGTTLVAEVTAKLAEMKKSATLKQSIAIAKGMAKTMKRLDKMKTQTPKARASAAKKLEKLIAGHEDLPIAAKVKETIAALRK